MAYLETELRVTRGLYQRRLRTLKRLEHHLQTMDRHDSKFAAGEIALRIAQEELHSAKERAEYLYQRIRHNPDNITTLTPSHRIQSADTDYFQAALNRADPKQRLKLAK